MDQCTFYSQLPCIITVLLCSWFDLNKYRCLSLRLDLLEQERIDEGQAIKEEFHKNGREEASAKCSCERSHKSWLVRVLGVSYLGITGPLVIAGL